MQYYNPQANSVLPAEYLGNSLSLPTLIASAMAFDCQEERKYVHNYCRDDRYMTNSRLMYF